MTLATGGDKTAGELGKGGVAAGKSWFEKARAKTEASREMEAKGRRIASAVVSIFEHEGGVDEGTREAAVLAATEALNRAAIDGALLVELDLDPNALARHVLAPRAADRQAKAPFHDARADELTHRLVLEASRHIISTANLLPGFTPTLDQQQLRRLRGLRAEVEQLPGRAVLARRSAGSMPSGGRCLPAASCSRRRQARRRT